MRLIDADAFLADESEAYMKAQIEIAKRTADKTITAERYINQLVHKKIQMLIADAPTIEPKRGEWKIEKYKNVWGDGYLLTCSECGDTVTVTEAALPYEHFCRNCGADMRPKDDE